MRRPVSTIKVVVAHGQRLMEEALTEALDESADFSATSAAVTSGPEALAAIIEAAPDVILLDYWMAGLAMPECLTAIGAWLPDRKVIVMSGVHRPDLISAVLTAGAVGYLPESVGIAQVETAIRQAHSGRTPVLAAQLGRFVDGLTRGAEQQANRVERLAQLSARELDVLVHLGRGEGVDAVARSLSITVATTRTHVRTILRKTNVQSQAEAVAFARRERLI